MEIDVKLVYKSMELIVILVMRLSAQFFKFIII